MRRLSRRVLHWLFLLLALQVLFPPALRGQEARPVENAVAFAHLFGYLRYFHPTDEAQAVNWNTFAARGIEAVRTAPDAPALAERLRALIAPFAPAVQVYVTSAPPAADPDVVPPDTAAATAVVGWRHNGVGLSPSFGYSSDRLTRPLEAGRAVPQGLNDPREPFEADLGGGVSARIPLAVFENDSGTYPRSDSANPWRTRLPDWGPLEPGVEWGSLVVAWNVFQHFYPYFDQVEADWTDVLRTALVLNETRGHETALRYLVASLNDGHGGVYPSPERYGRFPETRPLIYAPPLAWEWIEDRLVVTAAAGGLSLAPGDVVTHVGGVPAAEAVAAEEALISGATPQWKRYRALTQLLVGPQNTTLTLTVLRADGREADRAFTRSLDPNERIEERRPGIVAELEPGYFYVDLTRTTTDAFVSALPRLADARGIVFDMRGYPGSIDVKEVLSHFSDQALSSAQWHVPVVTRPDRSDMTFGRSSWIIEPASPRLTSNVAYLTDGRAISYAETWMGIVEHYRLARIVGQPTAGTNGNVNPFAVPSLYTIYWTGMKVLKHDGTRHHGVGILPTHPVARTIEGVRAGRDEALARALQALRETDVPASASFALRQNHPNPFATDTDIVFELAEAQHVTVEVFDALGRRVAVLVDADLPGGRQTVRWDADGQAGGLYFYRIRTEGFAQTRAMVLAR